MTISDNGDTKTYHNSTGQAREALGVVVVNGDTMTYTNSLGQPKEALGVVVLAGGGGGGAVDSVNGQTGEVVLAAADIGALPDTYTPPAAPVASVNGETGAVVLTATDVGAATAAQGATADTALQPADLSFAAVSALEGDWRGQGVETLGAALLALQAAIVP